METKDVTGKERHAAGTRERLFSVESANGALVLVRRIVQDAVRTYGELMRLRAERHELATGIGVDARLEELRVRIERMASRLRQLDHELADIGCEMKDFARGLVDFPALRAGRKVLLCWHLGEPQVAHWHDVKAGYAGRRPIDGSFTAEGQEAASTETDEQGESSRR